MKAPTFSYLKAESLSAVFDALDRYGEDAAIRAYFAGNFCRCTGYHSLMDAIEAACRARRAKAGGEA